MKILRGSVYAAVLAANLSLVGPAVGQTPDEHAQHHPQPGGASPAASGDATGAVAPGGMGAGADPMANPPAMTPPPALANPATGMNPGGASVPAGVSTRAGAMTNPMGLPPPVAANPVAGGSAPSAGMSPAAGAGMAGGMGAMMGTMMGAMMAPKPGGAAGCMGAGCGGSTGATPIYPSLMTLPALTPEKRAALDALARQQTSEGMTRLAQGSAALNLATEAGDEAASQRSVGLMHEALNQIEAGIAARRVLTEGKAPRNLALDWFKREMNLVSPVVRDEPHALLGLSLMHLFTMALLIAFGLVMLAMSYFRMRRASALFGRIEPDPRSPPPGSAPPLDGGPAPSGGRPPPPVGSSPSGDKSTAFGATDKGPNPREPPAGKALKTSAAAPLAAKWAGKLRVESIAGEAPSIQTFRLCALDGGRLPFTYMPGQFLNVAFAIGGARMNRSYSISSSPHERASAELTIKREPRGAVSRHLNDLLKTGDEIEAGGPVGRFTFTGTEAENIVLLSAGVGITPMMSIARYLTEQSWPGDIFFIYSCRTEADFIFQKAIAALEQRNPKLHVTVTMSNPGPAWTGLRGRITRELLIQAVPNLASRRVHVCGPPAMMDAAKALLMEIGVLPESLKTEQFGAVKPAPAVLGASAKPNTVATGPQVIFSITNKAAKIHEGQSILELSEELGIGIEFSCRVGTCGICKVKMTVGEVDQEVEDALDDEDKKSHIILACQAKPTTEVTVEA